MKINNINFEASIKSKYLSFKKSKGYYFDLCFQIFVNLALIFGVIINVINWKDYGTNERSFVFIYIVFVLYCSYLLFRKLTESKLTKIETKNSTDDNRILILNYLNQNDIKVIKNSKTIIYAIDDLGNTGPLTWKKNHIAILLNQEDVFFTIITERNKVNFPSIYDKISFRKDVIKVTSLEAVNN